jgi:2-polyprenyl-6-methoxyphenol hydroxylase-like FAD-dependent oxidoreductase
VPDVHRFITQAEPLDDPVPYRFRGSLRRRYDRLKSPCEGFIAVGDAACCLNPIYAHGMTVAAQQALALQGCLRSGGAESLARRFFARTANRSVMHGPSPATPTCAIPAWRRGGRSGHGW